PPLHGPDRTAGTELAAKFLWGRLRLDTLGWNKHEEHRRGGASRLISTSSIGPDASAPVFGALGNGHGTENPLPRSRSAGGRTISCCCMPTENLPASGGPLNNRRQLRGHRAASEADDLISSVRALIAAGGCR